jgi:protein phosphatase
MVSYKLDIISMNPACQVYGEIMKHYGVTHTGLVRKKNEDRFLIKEFGSESLFIAVADGMGGHAAGDRASETVIKSLEAFDPKLQPIEDGLVESVRTSNQRIMQLTAEDRSLEGMGTTLTAAFFERQTAHWIHIGDSRLYLFRENVLVQITDDHNYPGMLLKEGELSAEEARVHPLGNMLMSCLGRENFEMDMGQLSLEPGDLLMLSSDGLHDTVAEAEIASLLKHQSGLKKKLDALLLAALAAGGRDNITIVAAEI